MTTISPNEILPNEILPNEILPKFCPNSKSKFNCKNCDYGTSKKSSFDDHLISAKHSKSMALNPILLPFQKYVCNNCNKIYKDNSGLWRYVKTNKCKKSHTEEKVLEPNVTEILLKLLQENMEIQKQLLMQSKEPTIINNK